MGYHIDIQHASEDKIPFSDSQLSTWAQLPLDDHMDAAELTLRMVSPEEITELNHQYRQQNKATNVLAFPAALPENITLDYPLLGDLIICPLVLDKESLELEKTLEEHWAHTIIHGVLHLLGYDHIKEQDAKIMQALETKLLAKLGFADPWREVVL
jgi:probable rRNA maturation factor